MNILELIEKTNCFNQRCLWMTWRAWYLTLFSEEILFSPAKWLMRQKRGTVFFSNLSSLTIDLRLKSLSANRKNAFSSNQKWSDAKTLQQPSSIIVAITFNNWRLSKLESLLIRWRNNRISALKPAIVSTIKHNRNPFIISSPIKRTWKKNY